MCFKVVGGISDACGYSVVVLALAATGSLKDFSGLLIIKMVILSCAVVVILKSLILLYKCTKSLSNSIDFCCLSSFVVRFEMPDRCPLLLDSRRQAERPIRFPHPLPRSRETYFPLYDLTNFYVFIFKIA